MKRYIDDLFLLRIDETIQCLEEGKYISALALALTLPDICGKAAFPNEKSVGKRYTEWYNQYMTLYAKSSSPYDADMPYLSGEVVYALRNSFLHAGATDIETSRFKDELCKVDQFDLRFAHDYLGDSSHVAYGADWKIVKRAYEVNVYLLCTRLCKVAREYYNANKHLFDFITYRIKVETDDKSLGG